MDILVTGGAGFIGSNLVDRLIKEGHAVTVVDNLSGGRREFFQHHLNNPKFKFIQLDVRDTEKLKTALSPQIELVYHLSANADIARGVDDPTLDFEQSITATFSLLQAMRHHGIKKLFYTSGSGVYGDRGKVFVGETYGPLAPVSMYGASKLSAEGLISAFVHLFDMKAWIVRPANIIGPRATHGVVFDFVKRLKAEPDQLRILGDGKQSKAYLHVDDVIDAFFLIQKKSAKKERISFYNISSNSFVTVKQIADIVIKVMDLKNVKRTYTGGYGGWKGDVPVMRLKNAQLAKLKWKPKYNSAQAVRATVEALK